MSRLKSMQGLGSDRIFRTAHFKANCDLEFNFSASNVCCAHCRGNLDILKERMCMSRSQARMCFPVQ